MYGSGLHCRFQVQHFPLDTPLTLSDQAWYQYQAASRASCPDGVLVLRESHKVVKWPGTVDFKF
jgi:hypothetical protein